MIETGIYDDIGPVFLPVRTPAGRGHAASEAGRTPITRGAAQRGVAGARRTG
jgi:hypothetical protein